MNHATVARIGCRLLSFFVLAAMARAESGSPLTRVKVIELPGVEGRIDHLAVDVKNQRLFLAALGNNTIEVIDLRGGRRLHTIRGLDEPQGLLYLPAGERLFAASAKDGTCRIYDTGSYNLSKTVPLGDDADNVRFDAGAQRVYVGYGSGALAVLDTNGGKLADIKLDAHPESFQLEKSGPRIFVNLPDSRKIGVIDRRKNQVVAAWQTGSASANFPMALDEQDRRLFVVCRKPATLLVLNTDSGAVVEKVPTVGDSDDVFYDQKRKRLYVSGGEGAIAVYDRQDPDRLREVARIPTVTGARTSLFSPDLDLLFLAVRRTAGHNAAVWVLQPSR